ncbi:hypothetical protein [Miltoncostaea marina]|uniref:hypothetical protein n=1 Tax=Miltoncostaea marina TaxID=2843215 RepID=UPI001C3D6166|nr:hypothetical protein [Miltoncostaea marina]
MTTRLRGYEVWTHDGAAVVGEVDGVGRAGLRLAAVPGHRGHRFVPATAVTAIDDRTGTMRLATGRQPGGAAA